MDGERRDVLQERYYFTKLCSEICVVKTCLQLWVVSDNSHGAAGAFGAALSIPPGCLPLRTYTNVWRAPEGSWEKTFRERAMWDKKLIRTVS